MKLDNMAGLIVLTAQTLLLGGCATSALWEDGRFAQFREPAAPPDLRLFHSSQGHDVLVSYTEAREDSEKTRRRAYWLGQKDSRIEEGRKPRFVCLEQTSTLAPIPIALDPAVPATQSPHGAYAVAATNNYTFTLYSAGRGPVVHKLPVYAGASARVKQVALTPLAVLADLTIVGGVIAYCCLPAAWEGLNTLNR